MDILQLIKLTAVCRIVHDKFWHNHDDDETHHDISLTRYCNGLLIKNNDEYFVLTCYHLIDNCIELQGIIKIIDGTEEEINLDIIGFYIEYDFAVLSINKMNKLKDPEYKKILNKQFKFNLDDIPNKLYLKFFNESSINTIRCNFVDILLKDFGTNLYPKIPSINIMINLSNKKDIYGLSGSILFEKNNLYGIVSHYVDGNIIILPSYCMIFFFRNILQKRELCGINLKTLICDMDEGVGHYIIGTFGINYFNIGEKRKFLNKDDIILKINNNSFTEDGTIYHKNIGICLPFDTYLLLDDRNEFELEILKKKNKKKNEEDYNKMTGIISKIELNKYVMFDIKQNLDYINYNGLIIVELSEKLYTYYDKIGVHFVGLIEDYYNNCIISDKKKPVVIIDINYDNMTENIKRMYNNIGFELPFIRTESANDYYLSVISKCNGIQIINLDHLRNLLKADYIEFKIFTNIKKSYKLSFSNRSSPMTLKDIPILDFNTEFMPPSFTDLSIS
jgi:hypothetical protein